MLYLASRNKYIGHTLLQAKQIASTSNLSLPLGIWEIHTCLGLFSFTTMSDFKHVCTFKNSLIGFTSRDRVLQTFLNVDPFMCPRFDIAVRALNIAALMSPVRIHMLNQFYWPICHSCWT